MTLDDAVMQGTSDFMNVRWRAQEDNLIGGWCITAESDPRTPADGALQIADFCRELEAKHIADLHNEWLAIRVQW